MSHLADFAAYAAAFEKAFESDDWKAVEPWFTEGVVYEVSLPAPLGGRFEGRAGVLAYLKRVLDQFDRRFASRKVELIGAPEEREGRVHVRGRATYTAPGVPDLSFELEEIARFEDHQICHLEDRYAPEELERITRYTREHGAQLGTPPLE